MRGQLRQLIVLTLKLNLCPPSLFQNPNPPLSSPQGSFGLCVSSSIDARRQFCVAARGQTISLAFYPRQGVVLYGSEQAAVKAGLNLPEATLGADGKGSAGRYMARDGNGRGGDQVATRLDLDDLGGEIVLIDWVSADKSSTGSSTRSAAGLQRERVMGGAVELTLAQETLAKFGSLKNRLVPLEDNELITPLPALVPDLVGADIRDIPKAVRRVQTEWQEAGLNRLTMWNFEKCFRKRLALHHGGAHPGSVDVLVTGCEVSLWLAEQFASDLSLVFPALDIKTLSANKLLGLLGQDFAMPQTGYSFHEGTWDLKDTIVVIVSHSGGTFASLSVANLLQADTSDIFVVSSEWDTQIGKQLRKLQSRMFESRIFATDVGMRPAEPCSVSVVATHALLTEILVHLMEYVVAKKLESNTGEVITASDAQQLRINADMCVSALEQIVGATTTGGAISSATHRELRARGRHWARHVLEAPKVSPRA